VHYHLKVISKLALPISGRYK
jgi:hypothetical protein